MFTMKSNNEIKASVKKARELVAEIYKDDPRLQNPNPTPSDGVVKETEIVFKEILRYLINN